MNAKPNVSDWQHNENRGFRKFLENEGFEFEVTSQGYKVSYKGKHVHAAGTLKRPHGRYREANLRDNLQSAVSIARRYYQALV